MLFPQADLPEGTIHKNREVIKVKWRDLEGSKVKVLCHNGEEYEADHVIVTVSIGKTSMEGGFFAQKHIK